MRRIACLRSEWSGPGQAPERRVRWRYRRPLAGLARGQRGDHRRLVASLHRAVDRGHHRTRREREHRRREDPHRLAAADRAWPPLGRRPHRPAHVDDAIPVTSELVRRHVDPFLFAVIDRAHRLWRRAHRSPPARALYGMGYLSQPSRVRYDKSMLNLSYANLATQSSTWGSWSPHTAIALNCPAGRSSSEHQRWSPPGSPRPPCRGLGWRLRDTAPRSPSLRGAPP